MPIAAEAPTWIVNLSLGIGGIGSVLIAVWTAKGQSKKEPEMRVSVPMTGGAVDMRPVEEATNAVRSMITTLDANRRINEDVVTALRRLGETMDDARADIKNYQRREEQHQEELLRRLALKERFRAAD